MPEWKNPESVGLRISLELLSQTIRFCPVNEVRSYDKKVGTVYNPSYYIFARSFVQLSTIFPGIKHPEA